MTDQNLRHYFNLYMHPENCHTMDLVDWSAYILFLRDNKLLGSFYHRAQISPDVFARFPEKVKRHLTSAWHYASRQKIQTQYQLELITDFLSKLSLKPYVLKGAAYHIEGLDAGEGRVMSDIDLLVRTNELDQAERAFINNNWQIKKVSSYDDYYYRQLAHEIPPLFDPVSGTTVDLHHNIYLPVSGKAPDIGKFLIKTKETDQGYKVLSPVGLVMHSIVHLMLNEDLDSGVRDLIDIHLLCNQFSSDEFWPDLYAFAETLGFKTLLMYIMLLRRDYFDASIPKGSSDNERKLSLTQRLVYRCFLKGLAPLNIAQSPFKTKVSLFLLYMRGHSLKMPLLILLKHLTIKSFFAVEKFLMGERNRKFEGQIDKR